MLRSALLILLLSLCSCQAAEVLGDGVSAVAGWFGGGEPESEPGPVGAAIAQTSGLIKSVIVLLLVLFWLAPSPAKLLARGLALGLLAPFKWVARRFAAEPPTEAAEPP